MPSSDTKNSLQAECFNSPTNYYSFFKFMTAKLVTITDWEDKKGINSFSK